MKELRNQYFTRTLDSNQISLHNPSQIRASIDYADLSVGFKDFDGVNVNASLDKVKLPASKRLSLVRFEEPARLQTSPKVK
jgi:hypothetical protein